MSWKGVLNRCFPAGRKQIIKHRWFQQKGEKPKRVRRVVRVSSAACGAVVVPKVVPGGVWSGMASEAKKA